MAVHCESGRPTPDTLATARTDQRASSTQRRGRKRRAASKGQYRGDTWPTAASAGEAVLPDRRADRRPFARRTALIADQRPRNRTTPDETSPSTVVQRATGWRYMT